jgi:hypothetical protein
MMKCLRPCPTKKKKCLRGHTKLNAPTNKPITKPKRYPWILSLSFPFQLSLRIVVPENYCRVPPPLPSTSRSVQRRQRSLDRPRARNQWPLRGIVSIPRLQKSRDNEGFPCHYLNAPREADNDIVCCAASRPGRWTISGFRHLVCVRSLGFKREAVPIFWPSGLGFFFYKQIASKNFSLQTTNTLLGLT